VSLLFDQNLSRRLPALLAVVFPGCEQTFSAGLATADDRAVWSYAAAVGPPPKVVWLRIGNGPTQSVLAILQTRATEIRAFMADPAFGVLELL